MEQRRMHSQQLPHNTHDVASLDILQSPFYPSSFLDGSKVTQAPHASPSYVQQQYADSGVSIQGGGSPPLPYHIHEQPPQQGHPHLDPSPPPQQHQPCPTVAYPAFPQDHEGSYPTPQGLSHQLSRATAHPPRMPISPWPNDAFSDNASAHSTALRGNISPIYGITYPLRPQPLYHPPPTHRSVPSHAPPEQSQPTTTLGPSTVHEQQEDRAVTEQSQRSRSWGGVGSLDPTTGVFSRASDHPRMRTAQACEKCRARKAKCSGDHPICQRCLERGLECKYAAERRMRGPNKPKNPLPSMPDGSPQPAVVEGQKTRKRASTMPTVQRRGLQIWGQQQQNLQRQKQSQQQQEHAVVAAAAAAVASPASPASSAGSGSLGYPPLSESEASPMTPHSSLESRHSTGVSFPASPRVFVQDFSANTQPAVLNHVSEGNRYDQDGHHAGAATEGMVAGVGTYGQDVFPDLSLRLSFENPKTF